MTEILSKLRPWIILVFVVAAINFVLVGRWRISVPDWLKAPALIVCVVAIVAVVFFGIPGLLVKANSGLDEEQLLKARNDVRTAGIQIFGGGVLLVGLLFTNGTLQLSRQSQIADRFTKAIDQLGSDRLSVRLGGVYALERIARDSGSAQSPVMDVLAAFVRSYPRRNKLSCPPPPTAPPAEPESDSRILHLRADIQAAVTAILRRSTRHDPAYYGVDLECADLTAVRLANPKFGVHANLIAADLSFAIVINAELADADLVSADLEAATVRNSKMPGANFSRAKLQGTRLINSDLRDADFTDADLEGAKLNGANLRDANLSKAVHVTQDQIDSASNTKTTKLPIGLHGRP